MKRLKLTLLFVVTLAGVVAIAGCGSEGESSSQATASSGPLTKAEFIKRADEICREADKGVYFRAAGYRESHEKELNKLPPIPREERMIRIFVLPSIKNQIEGIEALEAPKGDEKEIEQIINEMKAGLKAGEKEPYSVSYEVPGEYPFNELAELGDEYGFQECTNPT